MQSDIPPYRCPLCKVDLTGAPVQEGDRWLHGDATHYSRVIAICDYTTDRVTAWHCPECDRQWRRDGDDG